MRFQDIERCFNRAFLFAINKRKLFLVFPFLLLCSVIIVFCRTLAFTASGWIVVSLIFFPILISFGIFLSLGILLNRIYFKEVKNIKLKYFDVFKNSFDVIQETSYVTIPLLLIFVILWVVFGFFVLLKEIPAIGSFFGSILSFIPFLLIFSLVLLCVFSLAFLFFIAPSIAIKKQKKMVMIRNFVKKFKMNVFSYLICFFIAILPLAFISFLFYISTAITSIGYNINLNSITHVFRLFSLSLPISILLTPFVIFFFNFSLESYNYFQSKESS